MSATKPVVLVVDDTIANIQILDILLRTDYTVRVATNGKTAVELAHSAPMPDIILLDIMMPGIDGYETCKQLKDSPVTQHIPVIFVTAMTDEDDEAKGLNLGAVDFITKPFSPRLVQSRVQNHLLLKKRNDGLNALVEARTLELFQSRSMTIEALASLAETRDQETGGHIQRTKYYIKHLAELVSKDTENMYHFSEDIIRSYFDCAPLHDIGKVGIPDTILLKPGKLSSEEFAIMKTHAALGYETLTRAEKNMGSNNFLSVGATIAHTHHEKWDGSGYPNGLIGEDIHQSGRLMAIVDVYDALSCKRVYKKAYTHDNTMKIMLEGKAKHFDPIYLDVFMRHEEDFRAIASKFPDSERDPEDSPKDSEAPPTNDA